MTGRSYYGRPVLKAPVWKWYVPAYFFTGGLAGASSTLALGASLSGNPVLARSARLASAAAMAASLPLLVVDLGRPARFANMLRVAKPTSPMSVGSWLLASFGPAATLAAASDISGRLPRLGAVAGAVAGGLGPAMTTYTGVLVANTAVPAWHGAFRELPFLFAGSAAASAGGVAMAFTPVEHAGPARRLALIGAALEAGAFRAMERGLADAAGPYTEGRAGRLAKAAEAFTGPGALLTLFAGRRRTAAAAAGSLLAAGSVLIRFSVFRAGFESAADPAATIGPQRHRVEGSPTAPGA